MNLPPEQQRNNCLAVGYRARALLLGIGKPGHRFSELVYSSSELKLILMIIVNKKKRDVIRRLPKCN
jgi:hypothetical protein